MEEKNRKVLRWLDYTWRIVLLVVGVILLISFIGMSIDSGWENDNLFSFICGGLCIIPFFIKKRRDKKDPQIKQEKEKKKQQEQVSLMARVNISRPKMSAGNGSLPTEVKIYSRGHKKASKDAKWYTRFKVRVVNILVVTGATIWFIIELTRNIAGFKGGLIAAIITLAGCVYLVAEFIEKRREHVITFDRNGVSIKEAKLFRKSYNHTLYEWEKIAYVTLSEGVFIFMNQAKDPLFQISGDTYDFSEKDVIDGLAYSTSDLKELPASECIIAPLATWKVALIALTLLAVFLLILFLTE